MGPLAPGLPWKAAEHRAPCAIPPYPRRGHSLHLLPTLELTAQISAHSPALIESGMPLCREQLNRYWSYSKARERKWAAGLDAFRVRLHAADADGRDAIWNEVEPSLADVLISEIVTRVWGAILTACDMRSGETEGEPVARNVLAGHLEICRRVLQFLVDAPGVNVEQLARIDRLRRRTERWTDLLLGHVVHSYGVCDFAVDPARALDFGTGQVAETGSPTARLSWQFLSIGLRAAFPDLPATPGVAERLRNEIVKSMLAGFPPAAFDADGVFESPYLHRLRQSSLAPETPATRGWPGLPPRLVDSPLPLANRPLKF